VTSPFKITCLRYLPLWPLPVIHHSLFALALGQK
jgi:hypothetical protein